MKKALCLLLCLLMLLPFSFACANQSDTPDDTKPNSTTAANSEEDSSAADPIESGLAQIKLFFESNKFKNSGGNNTFMVVTRNNVGNSVKELKQDKTSSEPLEDAVYLRNTELSELCGLEYYVNPVNDVISEVKNQTSAGSSNLCIAFPHALDAGSLATDAKLHNFNHVFSLSLDGEWWDQGTRELTLAGGVYFMNSEINYMAHDCSFLTLYSKNVAESKTLPNMYDVVNNNEWTLDKMIALMEDVANDVNGDGIADSGDTYGLISTTSLGNMLFYASNLKYIDAKGDTPELLIGGTEKKKIGELLDKIASFTGNTQTSWISREGDEATGRDMFAANQALFYVESTSKITTLRKLMDDDFGVLPLPKFDARQEYHLTYVHAIASTMVIPKSVDEADFEAIGSAIEAMALLSKKYVRPAYYDINLSSKGIRDEESAKMLDIVFAHRVYDMAQYYSTFGMGDIMKDCFLNSKGFDAAFARVDTKFATRVKTLLRKLRNS